MGEQTSPISSVSSAIADLVSSFSTLSLEYERLVQENARLNQSLSRQIESEPAKLPAIQHEASLKTRTWHRSSCHSQVANTPGFVADEEGSTDGEATVSRNLSMQVLAEEDSMSSNSNQSADDNKLKRAKGFCVMNIKGELDQMIQEVKPYDEKDYYKPYGVISSITSHYLFENTTLAVIMFNSIWMAIDTDYNQADLYSNTSPIFIAADQFFTFYFVSELTLRFFAMMEKLSCLWNFWFMFDLALVLLMVVENWILQLTFLFQPELSTSATSFLSNLSILRLARLLRLARILRMVRVLRVIPELLVLTKAMAESARSVLFNLGLLLFVCFVFGIIFTQICSGSTTGQAHFPSVLMAMNTCFLQGTLTDNASDLVNSMINDGLAGGVILYYVLVIVANFAILNLLTGVLCSVVDNIADQQKEFIRVSWVREVLHKILCGGQDDDDSRPSMWNPFDAHVEQGDETVTKNEFFSLLRNREAILALHEIGVDVAKLPQLADVLFADDVADPSLSKHLSQTGLPFDDFMSSLMRFRESNVATVKDIADLRNLLSVSLHLDAFRGSQQGSSAKKAATLRFSSASRDKSVWQSKHVNGMLRKQPNRNDLN